MNKRLFGFVGFAAMAIIGATVSFGQDQTLRSAAGDKWVITAKAGGVNYVQGDVSISRQIGKSGMLLKGDTVSVGEQVSTGVSGRAEILLNPGSYLRVAENSQFEFRSTELDDLLIFVTRGSVMLEVYAANDFKVTVSTSAQSFELIETGVYRVDINASGDATLEVWKGKAEVGDSVVKGGRSAAELDGQLAVAKFDRDERDDFETWSRDRSKELAKGTKELRDKSLRTSLMSSFLGGRWNMYDSFGLWVYDARFGRYCFLPFGFGWSSPYGFGFGHDIWWYGLPRAVYYHYPRYDRGGTTVARTPTTARTTPISDEPTSTSDRPSRPTRLPRVDRRGSDRRRDPIDDRGPAFQRMQGQGRGTGPSVGSSTGASDRSGSVRPVTVDRLPTFEPRSSQPASPRSESPTPVSRGGGSGPGRVRPID